MSMSPRHFVLALLLLVAVAMTCRSHAADPWESCEPGYQPRVRVASCDSTWLGWPDWSTCPTGQDVTTGYVSDLVASACPGESICRDVDPPWTYGGGGYNDQEGGTGYTRYVNCLKPDGSTSGTCYVGGSKVCALAPSCSHEVGEQIPQPDGYTWTQDTVYCYRDCDWVAQNTRSYNIQFAGGSCEIGTLDGDWCTIPGYLEVVNPTCISGGDEVATEYSDARCFDEAGTNYCLSDNPSEIVADGVSIEERNGYVCSGDDCITDPDEVIPLGTDGGMLGGPNAPSSGAAPDDGTAGSPASPTFTMSPTEPVGPSPVHYWDSDTVGGSTNYGDGSGSGGGGGGGGADGGGSGDGDNGAGSAGDGAASATCDAEPTCSNTTSVECAILRQYWTDTCRIYVGDGTSTDDDIRTAVGLTDSDSQMLDQLYSETDVTDDLGWEIPGMSAQACPAPWTFEYAGETYYFDLTPMCDFLRYMGVIAVVVSVLTGFRIISGA